MKANPRFKSPKAYVLFTLAVYFIVASVGTYDMKGLQSFVAAVGTAVAADFLCCFIKKKKRFMPEGAIITGLIAALILSTTTAWPIVAATAAIAILSKHLLVYKKKPIFNPAAFGLFLSIPLFHTGQSWWGAFGDLPAWTVVLLLIGGYAVTSRVSKYPQVFSFFGAFFLLLFIMGYLNIGDAFDALRPPFLNAALFLGFIMLTDPPTSPAKTTHQIVFGILTALASVIVYDLFGGLTYLFIGLLIGNLYHLLSVRFKTHSLINPHSTNRSSQKNYSGRSL